MTSKLTINFFEYYNSIVNDNCYDKPALSRLLAKLALISKSEYIKEKENIIISNTFKKIIDMHLNKINFYLSNTDLYYSQKESSIILCIESRHVRFLIDHGKIEEFILLPFKKTFTVYIKKDLIQALSYDLKRVVSTTSLFKDLNPIIDYRQFKNCIDKLGIELLIHPFDSRKLVVLKINENIIKEYFAESSSQNDYYSYEEICLIKGDSFSRKVLQHYIKDHFVKFRKCYFNKTLINDFFNIGYIEIDIEKIYNQVVNLRCNDTKALTRLFVKLTSVLNLDVVTIGNKRVLDNLGLSKFQKEISTINKYLEYKTKYIILSEVARKFKLTDASLSTKIAKGCFKNVIYFPINGSFRTYISKAEVDSMASMLLTTIDINELKNSINHNILSDSFRMTIKKRGYQIFQTPLKVKVLRISVKDANEIKLLYKLKYKVKLNDSKENTNTIAFNDADDYLTLKEINTLYNLNWRNMNPSRFYENYKKFAGEYYYCRSEVGSFIQEYNNSITFKNAMKVLNTSHDTIVRNLKKLRLNYTSQSMTPFFEAYMSQDSFEKLQFYFDDLRMPPSYEKYIMRTERLPMNTNAVETIEFYEEFVISRFNVTTRKNSIFNSLFVLRAIVLDNLHEDLFKYSNKSLFLLFSEYQLTSKQVEELSNFLNYLKERCITKYTSKFEYCGRNRGSNIKYSPEAYDLDCWYEFGNFIFNKFHDREFIVKVCSNRSISMAWLYCSLHYISAWRKSDYQEMLPKPNLEVLIGIESIKFIDWILKGNIFTGTMGQAICNDIMLRLKYSQEEHLKNNEKLTFEISPQDSHYFGFLFALCECHRLIAEKNKGNREINTSSLLTASAANKKVQFECFGKRIKEIMPKGIFLNSRAIRTYMKNIENYGENKNWGFGYYLASIARGHKLSNYGHSETTSRYLMDTNIHKDIDEITYNIALRKPLSFIPYILLEALHTNNFVDQNLDEQTVQIRKLDFISSFGIEYMVESVVISKEVKNIVSRLVTGGTDSILIVLKKISVGELISKTEHCQCFAKIIKDTTCVWPSREHCIGCEYSIPEVYLLFEFKRRLEFIMNKINNSKLLFDRQKYINLLLKTYLPLLSTAASIVGIEYLKSYIDMTELKNKIIGFSDEEILK